MIKLTLLLGFMGISSLACASLSVAKIPPSYSTENRTNGYFIEQVPLNTPAQVQSLQNKEWYFTRQLINAEQQKVEANSCEKLTKLLNEGFKAVSYREQSSVDTINRVCSVWSHIGQLTASKTTYLSLLKHGEILPEKMPAELALIISKDDERRLAKASSWQDMSQISKIEIINADQAVYYDNSGGIQRLTIMAKGDYNQDGIEDAVLYMANAVEQGSYSSTYGYIITKLAADAPYTLLKQF
ncbi:hypothetical protein [Rheinheimera sp. MMS21-TC3]|uniref:hypothetical protein n=1 Tax=Rheinheimera sp. MMS21-TC3 TaxID=3072790 RepID=UPI0028C45DCF|nr:hypothetical protein [Rheinheimera sp. MMS21-TC3]WNO59746.1 hypothetical protein RDV63_01950 [Rheinheimera sp. MMS21-TC3]